MLNDTGVSRGWREHLGVFVHKPDGTGVGADRFQLGGQQGGPDQPLAHSRSKVGTKMH